MARPLATGIWKVRKVVRIAIAMTSARGSTSLSIQIFCPVWSICSVWPMLMLLFFSSLFRYLSSSGVTHSNACCHLYSNTCDPGSFKRLLSSLFQTSSCSGMTYFLVSSLVRCDLFSFLLSVNMIPVSIPIFSCSGMTYSIASFLSIFNYLSCPVWPIQSPTVCEHALQSAVYLYLHTIISLWWIW